MAVPKRGFGVCESTYWEAKTRLGGWRKHLLGCENALRIAIALFGKVSKTHNAKRKTQNANRKKQKGERIGTKKTYTLLRPGGGWIEVKGSGQGAGPRPPPGR